MLYNSFDLHNSFDLYNSFDPYLSRPSPNTAGRTDTYTVQFTKILAQSKKRILTWKVLRCKFQHCLHLQTEFEVNSYAVNVLDTPPERTFLLCIENDARNSIIAHFRWHYLGFLGFNASILFEIRSHNCPMPTLQTNAAWSANESITSQHSIVQYCGTNCRFDSHSMQDIGYSRKPKHSATAN